jgi:ATP-dependent RNA helicase DeaD
MTKGFPMPGSKNSSPNFSKRPSARRQFVPRGPSSNEHRSDQINEGDDELGLNSDLGRELGAKTIAGTVEGVAQSEAKANKASGFAHLKLPVQIMNALIEMGYSDPTPVQSEALPLVLQGRDVLATAQTGTGKTAAFGIPVLARLLLEQSDLDPAKAKFQKTSRVLVIAPTRELAEQIGKVLRELTSYCRRFRTATVIGGSGYGPQIRDLKMNPAFVVGTPGRLIDHLKSGLLRLDDFKTLVIDEADRLLDMGFEPQVEEIIKHMSPERQTLMFSATLPPEVKKMVARYLRTPARIAVGADNVPVAAIKQDMIELKEGDKPQRLIAEIDNLAGTMIIFTRTRTRADFVAAMLSDAGHEAGALHGDLTQARRRRVTDLFRSERIRILVATDIAARGLDISHVKHVINYDLPMVPEDYIHRIGRTGRAGAEGHALALVTGGEYHMWIRIQRLIGNKVGARTFSKPPPQFQGKFRGPSKDRGVREFRGERSDQNDRGPRRDSDRGPRAGSERGAFGTRNDRGAFAGRPNSGAASTPRPSRPGMSASSGPARRPSRREDADEIPRRATLGKSDARQPSERSARRPARNSKFS